MAVPFFNDKKIAQGIIERRHKGVEVTPEVEAPDNEPKDVAYETCIEDLLRAIQQKSIHDLGKAIKEIFEHLESMPHDEYEEEEQGEE